MTPAGTPRSSSYPLLLATVAFGGILAPLNSTMLAVALPELRDDFSIGHGAIGWLISAYLIAMAVAQPLGGRLGDQLGRARVFRLGLLAFLVLSLAAALSPSFSVLVLLRTGQALVGAAVIPNGMAMLRTSLPPERLGRSMGITGATMSFAAAVGPLLGGALLALGSWRLLFLANVPIVLVALACLTALRYPEAVETKRLELDWPGALMFAGALVALTLVLNSLGGHSNTAVLAASVVGLVALGAIFVQRQRTSVAPIVDWLLFRSPSFVGATGYVLLSNLVMYTTLLSIPFFIEEVQGKGSGTSSTLLGAMSILIAVMSPIGGRLSDEVGRRAPALAGSLLVVGALVMLLSGISRDVPYTYLAASLAVLGMGIGLSSGPAGTAAIESVSPKLAGTAWGTNSMMRYLGSIIGVGILGAILSEGSTPSIGLYRGMFAVLLVMAVIGFAATLLIHQRLAPDERERERLPPAGIEPPAIAPG